MTLNHFLIDQINKIQFFLRQRFPFSRKKYSEVPAVKLTGLDAKQMQRIFELQKRYQTYFENKFNLSTCLKNYDLLNLLDQFFNKIPNPLTGKQIIDIGCRKFDCAPAWYAFFKPIDMIGIELDASQLQSNLHTPQSIGIFFAKQFPHFNYLANNFLNYNADFDIGILSYPFVTPQSAQRWRLPLKYYQPEKIMDHLSKQLNKKGNILMINQGETEWSLAKKLLENRFKLIQSQQMTESFFDYPQTPYFSWWENQIKT